MEIERKYLIRHLPDNLDQFPHRRMEQAYLSVNPVVRVRQDGSSYYLTYKGAGLMVREEYNLPLTKESYHHLIKKADGVIIIKKRYQIPYQTYTIELDLFEGVYEGLALAEVEFTTEDEADHFTPPDWFQNEVTFDGQYHNSYMALHHPSIPYSTQSS